MKEINILAAIAAKQIQLQLFGSGFGHLTLVLRSGLSVSIVKLKDIL